MSSPVNPDENVMLELVEAINTKQGVELQQADVTFTDISMVDPAITTLDDPLLRNSTVLCSARLPLGGELQAEVKFNRLQMAKVFPIPYREFPDEGEAYAHDLLSKFGLRLGQTLNPTHFSNIPVEVGGTNKSVLLSPTPNSMRYFGDVAMALVVESVGIDWKTPIPPEGGCQNFDGAEVPFNGTWELSTSWASDDGKSIKAPTIGHGQSASTYIDVQDGTDLSVEFSYKVESESGWDFLRAYVNGVQEFSVSGISEGVENITLNPGPNTITWTYSKDGSVSSFSDTAWLGKVCIKSAIPPPFTLPIEEGFIVSHPSGTAIAVDGEKLIPLNTVNLPNLSNTGYAGMVSNGADEVYALNGTSISVIIGYMFDAQLDWSTYSNSSYVMASNSIVWFKDAIYAFLRGRFDANYGLYKILPENRRQFTTYTFTKVKVVTGTNCVVTANDNTIVVYDHNDGQLHHSANGSLWVSTPLVHTFPAGAAVPKMYRVDIAFSGDILVGVGAVNSSDPAAPTMGVFSGIPGSAMTFIPCEPYGAGIRWSPVQVLLTNMGADLVLAVSQPQNGSGGYVSGGDIFYSIDVGTTWPIVESNTGIYPISLAKAGPEMILTGYMQDTGIGQWMVYSKTSGTTWAPDPDASSFYSINQSGYTFAVGMPARQPLVGGFFLTNPGGAYLSADCKEMQRTTHIDAPFLDSGLGAVLAYGKSSEIYSIDTISGNTTTLKASISGALDWEGSLSLLNSPLVDNQAVMFRGHCYVVLRDLSNGGFDFVYRLTSQVIAGAVVLTPEKVLSLQSSSSLSGDVRLAANDTHLVVFDAVGIETKFPSKLHYTTDGVNWNKQETTHPFGDGDYRVADMCFVNSTLVVCAVPYNANGDVARTVVFMRGLLGGAFTWTEPTLYAGVPGTWLLSAKTTTMSSINNKLVLHISFIQNVTEGYNRFGDLWTSDDTATSFTLALEETGMTNARLAFDGTVGVLVGKVETWQTIWKCPVFTFDFGATWEFSTDPTTVFGRRRSATTHIAPRLSEAVSYPTTPSVPSKGPPTEVSNYFNQTANGAVNSIAVNSDDTAIVSGNFTTYGGVVKNRIAKVNVKGSLVSDFTADINAQVNKHVIQPDDKIIIGGHFTTVNGVACSQIARLNPDGTLDGTFANPTWTDPDGAAPYVTSLLLQPDGKLLVTGRMFTVNGVVRPGIVRLNSDGTLDETFVTPITYYEINTTKYMTVHSVHRLQDGNLIISSNCGGVGISSGVNILTPDGAVFAPGGGHGMYGFETNCILNEVYEFVNGDVLLCGTDLGFDPSIGVKCFRKNGGVYLLDNSWGYKTLGVRRVFPRVGGGLILFGQMSAPDNTFYSDVYPATIAGGIRYITAVSDTGVIDTSYSRTVPSHGIMAVTQQSTDHFLIGSQSVSFTEHRYPLPAVYAAGAVIRLGEPDPEPTILARGYQVTMMASEVSSSVDYSGSRAFPCIAQRSLKRLYIQDGFGFMFYDNVDANAPLGTPTYVNFSSFGGDFDVAQDTGHAMFAGGTSSASFRVVLPDGSVISQVVTGNYPRKVCALSGGKFALTVNNAGTLLVYGPSNNFAAPLQTYTDLWGVEALAYDLARNQLLFWQETDEGGMGVVDLLAGTLSRIPMGGKRGYMMKYSPETTAVIIPDSGDNPNLHIRNRLTGEAITIINLDAQKPALARPIYDGPSDIKVLNGTVAVLQMWRLTTDINTKFMALHVYDILSGTHLHTTEFAVTVNLEVSVTANERDGEYYVGSLNSAFVTAVKAGPSADLRTIAMPVNDIRYVTWL